MVVAVNNVNSLYGPTICTLDVCYGVMVYMRFKDTLKQKYKHEEYSQVRKTGVDAVGRGGLDPPGRASKGGSGVFRTLYLGA